MQKNKSIYITIEAEELEERTKNMKFLYRKLQNVFSLPVFTFSGIFHQHNKIRLGRGNMLNVIQNCRNRLE